MDNRELTLTDLLADPMILAVMAADRVDPAALEATLSGLARSLSSPGRQPGELRRHCLPAPEAGASFSNSLGPVKRAPTDQMRQSASATTINTSRRTKP